MSDTAREIFPFVRLERDKSVTGERAVVVGGTVNPDGTPAGSVREHLKAVPEPTAEELTELEAQGGPDAPPDIPLMGEESLDMAGTQTRAEGNSRGAPSKA